MAFDDIRQKLDDRLRAAGLTVPEETKNGMLSYFGLIAKWNRRLNLTALKLEPAADDAIDRLLVEPACAVHATGLSEGVLVDLGSGGGSPAIPIKLCAPMVTLTMVEARTRKAAFLRDAVRQLALKETETANCRFEQLEERPHLHHCANVVSVRAVRSDPDLWRAIAAVLKPGGRLFWFASAETRPAVFSAMFEHEHTHKLPGTARLIVLARHSHPSPRKN